MHTPLHATDPRRRRPRRRPPAARRRRARGARSSRTSPPAGSATPARRSLAAMCAPMRAALGVALAIEGVAPTPAAALALADAGEIALLPNHDCGGVGPMSGVVTGSMPVLVARDEATGMTAWCPLNEGSGKVLRYGADGPGGRRAAGLDARRARPRAGARARRARAARPARAAARVARAGDECHHRTDAGTRLIADALAPLAPDDVGLHPRQRPVLPQRGDGVGQARAGLRRGRPGLVAGDGHRAQRRRGRRPALRHRRAWFTGPAALPDPARCTRATRATT